MSARLEDELRTAFSARAGTVTTGPVPFEATSRRIGRARRRRRAVLAGAVCAVTAVLTVAAPTGFRRLGENGPVSAMRWPVRGSLAKDTGFVSALRDDTIRRGAAGTVRVLYAGDDGRYRVAVVAAVKGTITRELVRYGRSGASPRELEQEELGASNGPVGPDSILWSGPAGPLLVLGPPDMTDVKVSPGISYRPDGTPFRTSRTIRADHGAVLTEVAGVKPGQLSVKFHLPAGYTAPRTASATVTGEDSAAYRHALAAAVARAAGHVDAEQARGLLFATAGYLGTTDDRLTYRSWWGGTLGGSRDAIVVTLQGPAGPAIRVVQTTHTEGDGGTEQERYAVPVRDHTAGKRPIGWTTAAGGEHATAAVYVPGRPGVTVELWNRGARLATRTAGTTGLAVFETGLSQAELRAGEYRVLNANGSVADRGPLGLPDLGSAIGWSVGW